MNRRANGTGGGVAAMGVRPDGDLATVRKLLEDVAVRVSLSGVKTPKRTPAVAPADPG